MSEIHNQREMEYLESRVTFFEARVNYFEAEIERLRKCQTITDKSWREIQAENAKLRAALVKVVRGTGDPVMVAYAALGGEND